MVDATIGFLAAHGMMLAGGGSALLLAGMAVALLARGSAVLRQRGCELGVMSTLVWLVLACVPLPRVGSAVDEVNRAVSNAVATRVPKVSPVSVLEIPAELIAKPQAGDAAIQGDDPTHQAALSAAGCRCGGDGASRRRWCRARRRAARRWRMNRLAISRKPKK